MGMKIFKLLESKYLKYIIKDQKLILFTTLVFLFASVIYACGVNKNLYKSSAKIWIKKPALQQIENEYDVLPDSGLNLKDQKEILKSKTLNKFLNDYIKANNLRKEKKEIDFNNNIIVNLKHSSNIINVDMLWDNPEEAQLLLSILLNEYNRRNLDINKAVNADKLNFLNKKLKNIQNRLERTKNNYKYYKLETGTLDSKEQIKKLLEQKKYFTILLNNINAEITSTNVQINNLKKQLGMSVEEAINAVALGKQNTLLNDLKSELFKTIRQYQTEVANYKVGNPRVIHLAKKINILTDQIENQVYDSLGTVELANWTTIHDSVRTEMARNLIAAETRHLSLKAEKICYIKTLNQMSRLEKSLSQKIFNADNLKNEIKKLENLFNKLKSKQLEVELNGTNITSNIVILDPPDLQPEQQHKASIGLLLLSLILGAFTGIIISIIKTFISDSSENLEEIEKITKTNVLGVIPWLEEDDENSRDLYDFSIKSLVSSFLIKNEKLNTKMISFSSTQLNKMGSNVIYSVAKELRGLGYSVALLDTEMRHPILFSSVNQNINKDLSSLIIELELKISQGNHITFDDVTKGLTQDENGISLLLNTKSVHDPYKYFGTTAFKFILATLKKKYDWVLVDTSSINISPEFLIIAKHTDGVVLFVDKLATTTKLDKTVKLLKNSDIPLIGSIVRTTTMQLEKDYKDYIEYIHL